MTADTTRGKATHEFLQELWRLLLSDLRLRLSRRAKAPSAEMLQVARRFLKDNGQGCPDEDCRKQLDALYRTYLRTLSDALKAPTDRPPAALLAEARAFLAWHGVGDIPGTAAGKAADQLLAADVPFKVTRH